MSELLLTIIESAFRIGVLTFLYNIWLSVEATRKGLERQDNDRMGGV